MLILVSGCDNPGSVGSGLTDEGGDVQVLRDTIQVTGTRKLNSFTGSYRTVSAGQFNDPLFGKISSTGFLKPTLPSADTLFAKGDAIMKMRLLYDPSNVYGDSLTSQSFDVFPITEYWRSNTQRMDDELEINEDKKVASFTVGEADSLEITLDPEWVKQHFQPYAEDTTADSTYKYEQYGLALVPQDKGKVVPIDMKSTSFVIENSEDTVLVPSGQWAYHMSRSDTTSPPPGTAMVHNMLEQVLTLDLGIDSIDVNGPNISRAELVIYQDQNTMEQTLADPEQRPQSPKAFLHFIDPNEAPQNLLPGNPVAQAEFSDKDNAYHFELTQFISNGIINELDDEKEFYLTLPNNGGILSDLLFVGPETIQPPELVITYFKKYQ